MNTETLAPVEMPVTPWHALPFETIATLYGTNLSSGLSESKVHSSRNILKRNRNRDPRRVKTVLLRRISTAAVCGFAVLTTVTVLRQMWSVCLYLVPIFLLCAGYVEWKDWATKRAQTALLFRKQWSAKVMRDGCMLTVEASDLVPGDVVRVESGDTVPADGRLFLAESLVCDERVFSPQFASIKKSTDVVPVNSPTREHRNMIYMGTVVKGGRGQAIVVGTGACTAIGRL